MPRRARIHYVSLRSSLVNLPISIYGPLLERSVRPQHLAVHLTRVSSGKNDTRESLEVYVGWTGMASASSLAHFNASQSAGGDSFETIEIDPQYAQGLGLSQGDLVEIGLVHNMAHAKMVGTEPLSSDDWEIIEIHASHVESTLLSQVRVAKIGQEIDIWVMGRTRVRLRVVNLDPAAKDNALLLTTNTEVSIAPKLHRNKQQTSHKSISNGQIPFNKLVPADNGQKQKPTPKLGNAAKLRVLPIRFAKFLPTYLGSELVAYVSPRTFELLYGQEQQKGDEESYICYQASFKRLLPPTDPTATTSSVPPPPHNPNPRVLKAGGNDKEPEQPRPPEIAGTGEVYVGCSPTVLDQHVVFTALTEEIEEWDMVRVITEIDGRSVTVDRIVDRKTEVIATAPTTFLAGVDDILKQCTEYCIRQFVLQSQTKFVHGVSGLLVVARSGAGKTSIVKAVTRNLQEDPLTHTYIHYVNVSKYADTPIPTVKSLFGYWFYKASWHKPAILVLDNLDKLLCAEVEHADSFRSRQLTEVFLSIYSTAARTAAVNCRGIILIATTSSAASIHPLLNTMHVFKEEVQVKPPNKDARKDILSNIVHRTLETAKHITIDPESAPNFTNLATHTEGYSALDLQDLVARAIHQVAMRAVQDDVSAKLTTADFDAAQTDFVPLSLRDVKLQKSDIAWSDVGGLYETRRVLRETLEWPTKYAPIFAQSPLRLRSGLLLYGYPGCGKTLLASAVAKECGLNFISVKGPEILNKYIGASEKSIRDLFERASAAKPCILFFDEFDSIAPKRGHDSTGVTDRVVNQLLTQMDGAEGLEGVYVLAATSRPDLIDSALLRPGRLDKSLLCNMPYKDERKDILYAVSRKLTVSPTIDFDELAEKTEGFSGADLQALMYNAHLEVIHDSIAALPISDKPGEREDEEPIKFTVLGNKGGNDSGVVGNMSRADQTALQKRIRQILKNTSANSSLTSVNKGKAPEAPRKHEITQAHIDKVLKTTRPSVPLDEKLRLDRIYNAFTSDRSGELPVPPDAGGIGNRVTLG